MPAAAIAEPSAAPYDEFLAFYREQFSFAWRTLVRLGVQTRDCEDAAQEVFVTAYRRWSTLSRATNRRAWLFGILRRVASRDRRRQSRHDRRMTALAEVTPVAIDLEDDLKRREAWERLAGFLDQLDADKREAFVLGELEELGRDELGCVLGINPNTAYSRLQAARRRFFVHFASHDDDACSSLLAHGARASTPPERADARTLAVIAPMLAPTGVGTMTATLGGLGLRGWSVIASALVGAGAIVVVAGMSRPTDLHRDDVKAAELRPRGRPTETGGTPETALLPATLPGRPHDAIATTVPAARSDRRGALSRAAASPPPPAVAPSTAAPLEDMGGPSTIDAELSVLVSARKALVDGEPRTAKQFLDEHRTRFGEVAAFADVREEIARELGASVIGANESGDTRVMESTHR